MPDEPETHDEVFRALLDDWYAQAIQIDDEWGLPEQGDYIEDELIKWLKRWRDARP